MKKPSKISNTADALSENVHRHANWLDKLRKRAKRELTPKMFEMFTKYDEDLVMSAVASSTRHTALSKFLVVIGKYDIEDIADITKEKVNSIVVDIMNRHSSNGQETHYSVDCKKQGFFKIRNYFKDLLCFFISNRVPAPNAVIAASRRFSPICS